MGHFLKQFYLFYMTNTTYLQMKLYKTDKYNIAHVHLLYFFVHHLSTCYFSSKKKVRLLLW